jgi:hypothetical protein
MRKVQVTADLAIASPGDVWAKVLAEVKKSGLVLLEIDSHGNSLRYLVDEESKKQDIQGSWRSLLLPVASGAERHG